MFWVPATGPPAPPSQQPQRVVQSLWRCNPVQGAWLLGAQGTGLLPATGLGVSAASAVCGGSTRTKGIFLWSKMQIRGDTNYRKEGPVEVWGDGVQDSRRGWTWRRREGSSKHWCNWQDLFLFYCCIIIFHCVCVHVCVCISSLSSPLSTDMILW